MSDITRPPYTITNDSIVVIWDGKSHTVKRGSPNFLALRQAILTEVWVDIPKNLKTGIGLETWAKGKFSVKGNQILFEDKEIPDNLNQRILKLAESGEDPTPVLNFWERLQKNPSYRSIKQLWSFLEHAGIPLTEDGCFLAYKGVRSDYKDAHSGTFDNKPGAINKMPRNEISDDPKEACHAGLHVGALQYATNFSQRTVVVKVDPQNVVCVPYDNSSQKMRVCEYEVIGNHSGSSLPSTVYKASDDDFDDDEDFEYEDDFYDDLDDEEDEDEEILTPTKKLVSALAVSKAKKKVREVKRPTATAFEIHKQFDKLSVADLAGISIGELRTYAAKHLKITGASKIPGGKLALLAAISQVRD